MLVEGLDPPSSRMSDVAQQQEDQGEPPSPPLVLSGSQKGRWSRCCPAPKNVGKKLGERRIPRKGPRWFCSSGTHFCFFKASGGRAVDHHAKGFGRRASLCSWLNIAQKGEANLPRPRRALPAKDVGVGILGRSLSFWF
jgi:hypothetical protein